MVNKNTFIAIGIAALIFIIPGCIKKKQRNYNVNYCNPAIYLPLDGVIQDFSQFKNAVKVHGSPTPAADRFGNINGALNFNGSTDYLELPHIKHYTGNSILVSAWVYPKGFGFYDNGIKPLQEYSGIFNKWDHTNRKGISTYATHKQIRTNGQFANQVFYDCGSLPGTFLVTNKWQHIAYQICDGKIKCYLNGNVVVDKDFNNKSGLLSVTAPIEIGRTQWHPSNARMISYFTGSIDDVRIYYNCCDIKVLDLYGAKP
jgi:hypothetical protein